MFAEAVMLIDREEVTGPEYFPTNPDMAKWASQAGSIYLGDQKVRVSHPRVRDTFHGREVPLASYEKLKEKGAFSEELLQQVLRGLSIQKYEETVVGAAKAFGVSPSSVSRRIVEITGQKLKEFQERSLSEVGLFACFLDTIHRGGEAFIVALGIDLMGRKHVLGFWEGSSENAAVCEQLFRDLERRGLVLSKRVLFVTDGGSGIIKALKDRFGKKLMHQRCTIHKDRNIQRHLPKKYRKEAHRRFRIALEQTSYEDARGMLLELEGWLREKNVSAAESLLEALEEILTVHRLKVPTLLRKTLHSTNPIESLFSGVRHCEKNIKRIRSSGMSQRWLGSVLLYCETEFRTIKGYQEIIEVVSAIEAEQEEPLEEKRRAA
jgi:transposase-like protein